MNFYLAAAFTTQGPADRQLYKQVADSCACRKGYLRQTYTKCKQTSRYAN
jgi:hypothetical protein